MYEVIGLNCLKSDSWETAPMKVLCFIVYRNLFITYNTGVSTNTPSILMSTHTCVYRYITFNQSAFGIQVKLVIDWLFPVNS